MRIYALIIIICVFLSGFYCVAFSFEDSDEDLNEPDDSSLKEVNRTSDGLCTFEQKKKKYVTVPVQYYDTEFFRARCPGYYFKQCLRERRVQRTRYDNKVEEYTEMVQKCCDGYTTNSETNKCQPICVHSCIFGSCTEPNKCTCFNGYEPNPDKPNECKPHCEGCENGECRVPNVCYCNTGYDWDSEKLQCVPHCSGNCHHGQCVLPEQCSCDDGYTHHETESICIPHCSPSCVNGQCTVTEGIGKCECDFEYQFVNGSTNECEPVCEMSCKNAKCVQPNVCECHEGYSVKNESVPHECHCGLYCIELDGMCHCLDEVQRVNGDQLRNNLSSICTEDTCKNGICSTPHDCECLDGFDKDENSVCVPVDEKCIDDLTNCNGTDIEICNCINGVCTKENTCVCVNGFKMSPDRNDMCVPSCSQKCQNGFCINPDSCECDPDYQRGYNESEWYICHPVCDHEIEENNGCINGTCVAPGHCECFEGFALDSEFNFTCNLLPVSDQQHVTPGSHWPITGTFLALVVVAMAALAGFYFFKRGSQTYNNMPKRDDEATEPIADYSNGEL